MGFVKRLAKIVRSGEERFCLFFFLLFFVLALEGVERAKGEIDRTVWWEVDVAKEQ